MKLKPYCYYKGKVNYHRTDDLKPDALPNGTEVHLQYLWVCDEDSMFDGDIAFEAAESVYWLTERDLIITEQITFDEFIKVKDDIFMKKMLNR